MIFIFLSLMLLILNPVFDFVLLTSKYLNEKSLADESAAQWADLFANQIHTLDLWDDGLRLLYAACSASMNPVAAAALQMQGDGIAVTQTQLLWVIEGEARANPKTYLYQPTREAPGPCGIPGTLRWPGKALSYRGAQAGFDIVKRSSLAAPEWNYAHEKVTIPWL